MHGKRAISVRAIEVLLYNENNHKQQRAISKIAKKNKQRSRLGTASNEITGGLQLVCGRPTLALSTALVPQTLRYLVCMEDC